MSRVLFTCVLILTATSLCFAAGETTKVFGKSPTITEATSIKSINSDPNTFVDKDVLVTGTVLNVCKGSGCWVEVMDADSAKIICRSVDESVLVPKDCEGRLIKVQGKLTLDKSASGKVEMKKEGDGPVHACPAPKLFVSTAGVILADAATAPATEAKTGDKPVEVKAAETPKAETTAPAVEKKDETTPPPAPQTPGK